MRLLQVPHGTVNVHGHVHEDESPTPNRHVNVSVGQLNYRPAKLSDIRRLARRLVEGRIGPGHNTPPETARDQPYQGNSSVERDVGREQKGGSKPHAYNRLDTAPQKRG